EGRGYRCLGHAADSVPRVTAGPQLSDEPEAGISTSWRRPGERGDPVGLPALSAVGGERLFEPEGVPGNSGEDEAHVHGPPPEQLLVVELGPAGAVEPADHRGTQLAIPARGPADLPLAGFGLVQAEAQSLNGP